MSADELFKAGRLREAIEAQILDVKAHPADTAKRLFLFELLAFEGDLGRARKQVDALHFDQPELQAAVVTYQGLLDAEMLRRELFQAGSPPPKFLTDPPAHVLLRLEAVARLQAGDSAAAAVLLAKANADVPSFRGSLNGQPFELLRDVDDLFGTVIEVMARGSYFWVPLEQVERLTMGAPRFPRDLLWIPARLELAAASGDVFVSALYPATHTDADELVQLGRKTDWRGDEPGPTLGFGLRTFLMGDDPIGMLEWRELIVESESEPARLPEA
ncbi:type VI secretion system protein ImpE [Singulisphaera sp. GP187]|uniref:type VI secretion system accessory protein TagJ n=1 Tax=Singulisphaera sp. GP187 TaxID=1882752 RepID=UPI00092B7D54|nr:type VI secretion system accessory protein TagJ [Singulisphaera sp. GP187]SIO60702.1 type VI secretion system protein ImpE [Singulisphaera sp. GP187]